MFVMNKDISYMTDNQRLTAARPANRRKSLNHRTLWIIL